jgi:hypothetical protein
MTDRSVTTLKAGGDDMTIRMLFRICAGAALLAGLCILLQRLVMDWAAPGAVVRVGTLVPEVGLIALTGLYLKSREALGRFGAWAFFLNFLGMAYIGCLDFARHYIFELIDPSVVTNLLAGPVRYVFLSAAMLFLVGTVFFGIAMFRKAPYSRVGVVLYTVGFGAFGLNAWLPPIAVTVVQIVGAAGVLLLGRSLWMLTAPEPEPVAVS